MINSETEKKVKGGTVEAIVDPTILGIAASHQVIEDVKDFPKPNCLMSC